MEQSRIPQLSADDDEMKNNAVFYEREDSAWIIHRRSVFCEMRGSDLGRWDPLYLVSLVSLVSRSFHDQGAKGLREYQ